MSGRVKDITLKSSAIKQKTDKNNDKTYQRKGTYTR